MNYEDSSGLSVKETLKRVAEQSKQSLDELIRKHCDPSVDERHRLPPPAKYPEQLNYLDEIFTEINRATRQTSDYGYYRRLLFSEIKAYVELFQLNLEAWEIEVITRLDEALTSQMNIERNRRAENE